MSIPSRASIAQVVAKLLSRRPTRQDEIPELMRSVQFALTRLGEPEQPELVEESREAPVAQTVRPRRARRLAAPVVEASEPAAPPPAPRLVRRAEMVAVPVPADNPAPLAASGGLLRGVVKWFDLRSRRGALRLPGLSGDVAVEPDLLDAMAITRLYKGQEVEATLSTGDAPRVVRLTLPGGAWQVSSTGGVVRNRHAKPVVVELKREALRRVVARAEAELLLGPGRAR